MLPYVEPKTRASVSDDMSGGPRVDKGTKDDMLINNLVYRQPVDLSLAKSRSHVKQFFQRSDYTLAAGKTAIADLNTGSSYINCSNSFLVFEMSVKSTSASPANYTFGRGSAMNIINRLNIRTKSGSEIDRVDYVPLWSRIDVQYNCDKDYKESVMSMAGFDSTYSTGSSTTTNIFKFAIPLERVAPCFRPLKGQLMPPQLASGLHIELVFEELANAISTTPGVVLNGYDITNIHFLLDQVDLSDEAQKAISVESAESGLEWVTPRVYGLQTSLAANVTNASVQIRKAVSQATKAYTVVQSVSQYSNQQLDSTASLTFPASVKFQYNLGSLYFPNQEVLDNDVSTPVSSYIEALYAFDKTRDGLKSSDVSISRFNTDSSILAMTSSRDDQLYLSGLNVNNSRALQFKGEFVWSSGDLSSHILTSFLEYMQVTKCYNDQSVVAI